MVMPIRHKRRVFTAIILKFMILIVLNGCSTSKYGKLEANVEVKRSFESYQILPNYKYYFRGVRSKPNVIVAINENYELNLKLWVQIDPNSEDFRIIINRVSLQDVATIRPWGSRILDHAGNYVGMWYSASRAAAVEINENRQIVTLHPTGLLGIGEQR
jgi:hypothetical protein